MTTFDYEQLNKKGLKDVVKWLDKQALPVKEVRGNNMPKRENGFQTKTVEIEFESGQVLVLKAKPDVPTFYQVKLNGKVMAIRDYKQLDNELREIAAYVKENEPKYAKNLEKQAAKAVVKVDVPKAVNSTVSEQTAALQAGLAELQGQAEALNNQLTEVQAVIDIKSGALADVQAKLDAEKVITTELESAIEKAKSGVFESAADDEADEDPDEEATETEDEEATEEADEDILESIFTDKDKLRKAGYILRIKDGELLGFTATNGDQVKDYSKIPKDIMADMERAVKFYRDSDKPKFTLSPSIKKIFESILEVCKKQVEESVDLEKDDPFFCPDCDIAMVDTEEGHTCPQCGLETDGEIMEAAADRLRDERGRYARRKKSGIWSKIKDFAGKGLSKLKDVASDNKGLIADIAGTALLGPLYMAGKEVRDRLSGGIA